MDFGILSFIGNITFIVLEHGSILIRIMRTFLFVTGTVIVVAVFFVITRRHCRLICSEA